MKVKSPSETAGLSGSGYGYLGHFRKKENLNQGHNDGPRLRDDLMPERRLLRNEGKNMWGSGKSPTETVNAYRGRLLTPEEAKQPSAPEIYLPGGEPLRRI